MSLRLWEHRVTDILDAIRKIQTLSLSLWSERVFCPGTWDRCQVLTYDITGPLYARKRSMGHVHHFITFVI